jgi:hypothetical protein
MLLAPAGSSSGQMTYVAQQGAPGYVQQQQLQADGYEQGSQVVMGYMPVMQQHGVPPPQQGMQYVTVPVQGGRTSDAGLAGGGPQSPQMQLMQQGQVLYAPAGEGPGGGVHAEQSGQQQQLQLQYVSYPPQQLPYGMQPAPQGPGGQYGGQYMPAGRQQLMIGYQPVQMGGMHGYSAPQGVLMVRPTPQRGATVAVIPAGPSAWSGSMMSAEAGEAPSLEALCAAMNHMAVPTSDAQPELLLQQYRQQAMPAQQQQQQQVLAAPHMQAAVAAGSGPLPQNVQPYAAAVPGVPQVLGAPGPQQQQHSGQLLPGQQVMLMMPQDGTTVQGGQLGWGGIGSMQPGT